MLRALCALFLTLAMASAHAQNPPAGALWNADKTAAVASSHQGNRSTVIAYVRQKDGSFSTIDLSRIEGGALGQLGRPRSDYERLETTATEWIPRSDGLLQLEFRIRAWRKGQRYTVHEPLVFHPDGRVIWR